MDWDDLRLLLAVARSGSFAAAARALALNHATVLRRIHGLETRLGVRLVERLPGGAVPTAAGAELAAEAAAVAERLDAAERRLAGRDVRLEGVVRVTTVHSIAVDLLAPHLACFRALHSGIRLELIAANEMFSLSRREADVAIRPTRAPAGEMVGRRVARIAFALYAAPDLLSRHGRPTGLDDLARFPFAVPDDSLAHLDMAKWLLARVPPAARALASNEILALVEGARAGVGIAALPCYLGDRAAGLLRVLPPEPAMASDLWLLTHPDLRRTPRIRAFLDFIGEALAGERDLVEGRRPRPEAAAP